MSKFDVTITLFTIVYGLMLTDLFFSLHRLLRHRKSVKWHWLPLLSAWYLFLIILKNWWDLAFMRNDPDWMNILYFIAYGHVLVLIFLSVSAVLPDDARSNDIDLKEYYFKNHRYFWGLMSSVVVVTLAVKFVRLLQSSHPVDILVLAGNGVFITLTITLAISRRFWVHSIVLMSLVAATVFEIVNR